LGDHNLNGGVREFRGQEAYQTFVQEVSDCFSRADLPEAVRCLDKGFERNIYSLKSLFRDEQRKILNQILDAHLSQAEAAYRQIYENQVSLMRFLSDLGTPLPKSFQTAAEFALNTALHGALGAEVLNLGRISALLGEAKELKVPLDGVSLGYVLKGRIERLAEQFRGQPTEISLLHKLEALVDLARSLPFEVDFWKAQNSYYEMLRRVYPNFRRAAEKGDQTAQSWVSHFMSLGGKISIRIA
jgi:hypothetical protein